MNTIEKGKNNGYYLVVPFSKTIFTKHLVHTYS